MWSLIKKLNKLEGTDTKMTQTLELASKDIKRLLSVIKSIFKDLKQNMVIRNEQLRNHNKEQRLYQNR